MVCNVSMAISSFCNFLSILSVFGLVIAVAATTDKELPCDFRDSINISSGSLDAQRNILHDGINYGAEHYGLINYDYVSYDIRITVPNYYRGCICQLTNCVRLCCPMDFWFSSDGEKTSCNEASGHLPFKVWANASSVNGTHFNNLVDDVHYGFVYGKPCPGVFPGDLDEWFLDDVSFNR